MSRGRVKLSELKTSNEVLKNHLKDKDFREEWNRTALARAVAIRIVAYRSEHSLSQTALARIVGMQQPAIARLEAGEKNPTWETISRLARALDIEFLVHISPDRKGRLVSKNIRKEADVVETSDDGTVLVAVR